VALGATVNVAAVVDATVDVTVGVEQPNSEWLLLLGPSESIISSLSLA
jgi:hypothetical protein